MKHANTILVLHSFIATSKTNASQLNNAKSLVSITSTQ